MAGLALRDRLAATFALALLLAYVAIAVCAAFVVDRVFSASIDERLSTVAQAIVTIADDTREEVDREDREQFAGLAADATGAIVLGKDGDLVLSTTEEVPSWVPHAIRSARIGRISALRNDGREFRVLVERRRKRDVNNLVIVWQSMQIFRDVERALLLVLGGFSIVVAIGGYAAGAQIARRGLLPLTRMSAIVADIAANDLDARLGPQRHADELGQLAATFDRMLDRLQSAFERQRRFTADASHDLRAPLATLRAEVDLALRRDRTTTEYRTALEAIAEDADQLDHLIDALLSAARSEGGELELRPLDLAHVASASVARIAPFGRAKGVAIQTDLPPRIEIIGDDDSLQRAVLATLHNAVKYSPPASVIHVAITATPERVELRVRDEGPGFTNVALTHALERFWRDDTARGRSAGSGLGLAIASEIVRRCGGAIVIGNAASGGAEVIMRFPVAQPAAPVKPQTV